MAIEGSKKINFFYGPSNKIQEQIEKNAIDGSDFVVGSDNDAFYFVDSAKSVHELGSSKAKESHTVNLGEGGTIGGLSTGDVISAGTTIDELIKKITVKRVAPTYVAPQVTLGLTSGDGAGIYEVGQKLAPKMTAKFVKNDAGALTKITINQSGQDTPILEGATSPLASDTIEVTVPDGEVKFTATATYAAGDVKKDNLGDDSPTGQIASGSKTSTAIVYTGKRKAFFGAGAGASEAATSENVRALSGSKLNPAQGTSFEFTVPTGSQYIRFAYPATLRDVNQVQYVDLGDKGMAANFVKTTAVVEGANGAAGISYKIYTYDLAQASSAPMTFSVTI